MSLSLEHYGLSPVTGFLPSKPPLQRLPDAYFAPWENRLDGLHEALADHSIRKDIQKLPLLDTTRLQTTEEYQRAFLVLCFLSHAYVWGEEEAAKILPAPLAVPLTKVSDHLGLHPVLCHASVALWNYRLIDEKGPLELSNMEALATFTGTPDESWFHIVTASIEIAGAPCLPAIVSALDHVRNGHSAGLKASLETIETALKEMNRQLPRMFERLDPGVFYNSIRPYLSGWKSLEQGLIYEACDDRGHSFAGASAAQSCLIAVLDVALGVVHHETGQQGPNRFMLTMRQHMPGSHRAFLEAVEAAANVRPFILGLDDSGQELVRLYNACVHQLKLFRDKHVQIVSLYVVNQARKQDRLGPQPKEAQQVLGTAGASVMPFLKQARNETNETKVSLDEKKSRPSWLDWFLGR
ncbi:hypothetical protein G6F46_006048 [Rhizopus delemar]|uniref:Indoleamine 2,3-dioxygenase isoform II n=1 Tax=Rhizopus delemar TaxID=936053 RepID=W0THP9_9FUNG|nr:hypothetical protein G6F54_003143 [Rhizopus delemar]KAG1630154.1 hypothetical protein G6F45_005702 [Rhizopus arrhizus]KAG1512046.1 hypothetical protein G6F53_005478 [Rhizopus delemar]KAG1524941.1 hypothetical protein G6F52_003761 [Rhizopus delemar]KAG1573646.1 hypothetical protein G6F50_002663 [Rhizopus delemar]